MTIRRSNLEKCIGTALAAIWMGIATFGCAQPEQSVRPGVNKEFEGDVDVQRWVERFEGESRETYVHRDQIVAAMGLKPGMSVADIGAGTGFYSFLFAEQVGPEGRVFAVDISDEFVAHIAAGAREKGLKNIQTVLCKADSVELPPRSVDVAFICDTYHHFEYPRSTMRSLHRALKPGGQVFIVDFVRIEGTSRDWILEHVRAGEPVVREEVESVGFRFEPLGSDMSFLHENYMIRFRRL